MNIRIKILLLLIFTLVIFATLQFIANSSPVATLGGALIIILMAAAINYFYSTGVNRLEKILTTAEKNILNTDEGKNKGSDMDKLVTDFGQVINKVESKEGALSREESQMESMLQALSEALIALDKSGKIIKFNKTAEKFTGFTSSLAMHKPVDDIISLYGGDEKIILSNYLQKPETLSEIHRDKGLHIRSQD